MKSSETFVVSEFFFVEKDDRDKTQHMIEEKEMKVCRNRKYFDNLRKYHT